MLSPWQAYFFFHFFIYLFVSISVLENIIQSISNKSILCNNLYIHTAFFLLILHQNFSHIVNVEMNGLFSSKPFNICKNVSRITGLTHRQKLNF